jgi:hypothetical protein
MLFHRHPEVWKIIKCYKILKFYKNFVESSINSEDPDPDPLLKKITDPDPRGL